MPSNTISATPPGPLSLEQLDRRLTREWDFRSSRSRALNTARQLSFQLAMRGVSIDVTTDFWFVWHAAEVLWDAEQFDDASKLVAQWRETIGVIEEKEDVDCHEAHLWAAILSAELEHRLRNSAAAVAYADSVLRAVRELAGGEEELRALLKTGKVTPLTQLACAALAIGIPAARLRFAGRPALRAQYLDTWIEEAKLLLRRDLPPKPLRRIHALVIQTYFAIAKAACTQENRGWLDRLEKFDDLVRPRSPRGQETRRLRLMVRAEFEGDYELARQEAEAARAELTNLARHQKALDANGWWPQAAGDR
jgi:hypothetical protein